MTQLDQLIPPADLTTAIQAGHVTRKTHPTLPLSIYTYTRAAQYERAWTPVTLRCRGLIADDKTGDIVAWPFPKFFKVGEHGQGHDYAPPLPEGEPFRIYDKADGSLGIVFHYDGRWRVASKGSFASEQAAWAQARIDTADTSWLIAGTTYLCEIVYPANRIVVDYGDRQDLILLGAYWADGREAQLEWAAPDWEPIGSVIRSWGLGTLPLADLVKLAEANSRPDGTPTSGISTEGYVIRYATGQRAKVKLSEYVRLHKVLTGITERDIWRMLGLRKFADQPATLVAKALGCPAAEVGAITGDPLAALLDAVPDEFDQWVKSVAARLEHEHTQRQQLVEMAYAGISNLAHDRGAFARAVQTISDPGTKAAMFLRLDGKPTGLHLWRSVKPEASTPFSSDDE